MINGSYSKGMFHFIINFQTVFQSGCAILHSHQKWMRVPITPHALQHSVLPVFLNFSYSNRCALHLTVLICHFPGFSACNAGHIRDTGSIPGLWKSLGGGHGNPLQYSCLENPLDRGAGGLQPMGSQSQTRLKRLSIAQNSPLLNCMLKNGKGVKFYKFF